MQGAGCRVQGSDLQGDCLAGVGARVVQDAHREDVPGAGFRVQGSGFRVQGSGFRVQGGVVLSAGNETCLVHHEDLSSGFGFGFAGCS